INHSYGNYFQEIDTLGTVDVEAAPASPNRSAEFGKLRQNADVIAEMDRYRGYVDRPPDKELTLTLRTGELPFALLQLLRLDLPYFNPVEWSGTMPMMDWLPTANQVEWILRDPDSGKENMAIDWRFKVGDLVKIRLTNDRHTIHAMAHP